MIVVALIGVILFLALVLYKASELLVHSIKVFGDRHLITKFLLAMIFAGIATSIPELFVGITSGINNIPQIGFGNGIGSNIANLGLAFSLAVLLSRTPLLRVRRDQYSLRTVFLLSTAAFMPFLLAVDGKLSRFDGLFLIALFFIYTSYIFNKRSAHPVRFELWWERFKLSLHERSIQQATLALFGSVAILLVGAHFLVITARALADILQIHPFLVGVFILSPSTTMPEFFIALAAVRKRETQVLYGDIFGSLVTNANLVIGVTGFIAPINILAFHEYILSLVALLTLIALFVFFSYTKSVFKKWEAALMVVVYLIFLLSETLL